MATSPESNAEFRITPAPRIEEETPPEGTSPAAESPASEPATQEMMVSDASTPFSLQAPMPVVKDVKAQPEAQAEGDLQSGPMPPPASGAVDAGDASSPKAVASEQSLMGEAKTSDVEVAVVSAADPSRKDESFSASGAPRWSFF